MFDFTSHFNTLRSDIDLSQEFLFMITHTNDYLHKSMGLTGYAKDRFLITNQRAYKVSAMIWLHKVYEGKLTVHCLDSLMQWLHQNPMEFTKDKLIERKISWGLSKEQAETYAQDVQDVPQDDFKKLFRLKRDLQGQYDKDVRGLRNNYYAHNVIDPKPSSNSVELSVAIELADNAKGIYEDIWGAYHNGKPFTFNKRPFVDRDGIAGHIEGYLEKYRVET